MPHRLVLYVGVAAAVVLLAAILGILLLLLLRGSGQQLSASETVRQACDMLAEDDHDAVIVATADSDRTVYNISFSGSDNHVTVELYVPGEETAVGQFQHVSKDGLTYFRLNRHNTPETWDPWEVVGTNPPELTQNTPCFSAEGSSIEESTGPGSSQRRFVWNTTAAGESVAKNELWVDSAGRPVRGLITVSEASATSAAGVIRRFETTYSGFGEPNVIAAPVVAPPLTPPGAPERPYGVVIGPGTVSLDWNDVATATSYDVRVWQVPLNRYVELSPGGPVRGIGITFDGSSATVSALPASQPAHDGWYAFQVRAVNDVGPSGWSGNNHIPVSDPGSPAVPELPTGTIISPGTVALDWNDVPTATSYNVRVWQVALNRYVELSPSAPVRGIGIAYNGSGATISGLPKSRPEHDGWYAFQVRAVNAAGSSAWSSNNRMPVP